MKNGLLARALVAVLAFVDDSLRRIGYLLLRPLIK